MKAVYQHLNDFLALFFPELCAACGTNLVSNEAVICTGCIFNLPHTNFHLQQDNRVAKQFWGRVNFVDSGAYLYFSKGSKVQNLMHQLKYNNRPEVGFRLGEMYGRQLKQSLTFKIPDLILPIPLHPARQKKRGYNQSDFFAEGLAASLQIPTVCNLIKRNIYTQTQTKKSRFVRYENMKDVFYISTPEKLQGKHVFLVDDIITTGATIESCANSILKIAETTISIGGIAYTE